MARKLNRREAIGAAAVGALALAGGGAYALSRDGTAEEGAGTTSTPAATTEKGASCVLTPEQTEGPYYLEDSKNRSDVTEGRPGLPLLLNLIVQDADSCEPVENATVEIWHTDALGAYSGVDGDSGTFMRGGQNGGREGKVSFRTVYPGWYSGRAPHIHVKVHLSGNEVHTGQFYFPDGVSRAVYARKPYDSRGEAETLNDSDGIYSQGGEQSTLKLSRAGSGYVGSLALGVRAA